LVELHSNDLAFVRFFRESRNFSEIGNCNQKCTFVEMCFSSCISSGFSDVVSSGGVSMIDFGRFWAEFDPGDSGELGDNPFDESVVRRGVDAGAIRDWEAEHGVRLPKVLRTVLQTQDGGFVRNASLEILPLEEIVPVDEDFWEYTEIDEDEAPDRDLVFVFGEETEVGGTYLLNFNAKGPAGEPSIYIDFHGESTGRVAGSLKELLEKLLASSPTPSVNWSETETLPVLARETIDISPIYQGKPAMLEQVLVRDGETLVLFARERSPREETLTRTRLPQPLDAEWARIDAYRPAPVGTFALHLQPEDSSGIVNDESRLNADGMWKNTSETGVPIYVMFESTRREELEALRTQLLGAEAAAHAQAQQDRQAELAATLDALPPEERMSAMLQSALDMQAQLDRDFEDSAAAADMPPHLAHVADMMRRKMAEMLQRAQAKIAATPPSPAVQQKIAEILRDLGPDGSTS
jgi:hypothetical protein